MWCILLDTTSQPQCFKVYIFNISLFTVIGLLYLTFKGTGMIRNCFRLKTNLTDKDVTQESIVCDFCVCQRALHVYSLACSVAVAQQCLECMNISLEVEHTFKEQCQA